MAWTFEYFTTTEASPIRLNISSITDVVNSFTIFENTGDEFIIQTGDLDLNLLSPLPFDGTAGTHNWLAAYFDASLYNVYHIGELNWYNRSYLKLDEKRNIYATRLSPIAAKFYRDIDKRIITYSATATDWEFDLIAGSTVPLEEIVQENPLVVHTNRIGFSLSEVMMNLSGKIADVGYKINNVNPSTGLINASNLPILFGGISYAVGTSAQTVIEGTFTNRNITWKQIFEQANYTENSFLVPVPEIVTGELNLNLEMTPRTDDRGGGTVLVNWVERTIVPNGFRIDGVNIKALEGTGNEPTDWKLGNTESGNVFRASVRFGNPGLAGVREFPEDLAGDNLYIAAGDPTGPPVSPYDIRETNGDMSQYIISDVLSGKFSQQLAAGDFYEGQIEFTGEKILDRVVIGSDTVHLTLLEANKTGPARVEAVVLK